MLDILFMVCTKAACMAWFSCLIFLVDIQGHVLY